MSDLYTFNSAITELQNMLGGRTDLGTRLNAWLDQAQLYLAKARFELPRLETTLTNVRLNKAQSEYNLLADFPGVSSFNDLIGVRTVRNVTSNFRMWRFDWDEYRSITTQAQSSPIRWARKGNLYAFDPQPDATYFLTIDYRRRPRQGQVEVDSEWQQAWMDIASFVGWRALNQYDKAVDVLRGLPLWAQDLLQRPLSQDEWEQLWDPPRAVGGAIRISTRYA